MGRRKKAVLDPAEDADAEELLGRLFDSKDKRQDLQIRRAKLLEWARQLGWPLCAPTAKSIILGLPEGKLGSPGSEASWRQHIASADEAELAMREASLEIISMQVPF